jgi:hypothetical protein
MTITVGTDTYVTLAEADAYAAARPALSAWGSLTEPQKEAALTEAALYLDASYAWKGQITDQVQLLSWPRSNVIDKEKRPLDPDTVPKAVKSAQIEYAALASVGTLVENKTTGNVAAIKAGAVDIKFVNGQNVNEGQRFASVDRLLVGLYTSRSGMGSINAAIIRG